MKTRKREKLEEKTGYTIPDSMHVYRQSQITKVLFIAEIEYRRIIQGIFKSENSKKT